MVSTISLSKLPHSQHACHQLPWFQQSHCPNCLTAYIDIYITDISALITFLSIQSIDDVFKDLIIKSNVNSSLVLTDSLSTIMNSLHISNVSQSVSTFPMCHSQSQKFDFLSQKFQHKGVQWMDGLTTFSQHPRHLQHHHTQDTPHDNIIKHDWSN